MKSSLSIKIDKYYGNESGTVEDSVAVEEPLEITLNYGSNDCRVSKIISITMRTPGHDTELAAGFLFTEGIIQNIDQISELKILPLEENKIQVSLKEFFIPELRNSERNFYTTSSCGVCGKTGINAIRTVSIYNDLKDSVKLDPGLFYKLNSELKDNQQIFQLTGGLHASVIYDLNGKIELLREDVGRHNALDKLIGHYFINNLLPLNNNILLLSGRASFELIQKAVMAGIKVVAAVGAPSSLAVELAKESDITLIGFLKNDRFNVYSGGKRVGFPPRRSIRNKVNFTTSIIRN
jgi:FdhD protein